MKKVLVLCAVFVLLLSQSAFAQENVTQPTFDSVKAKKELAGKYPHKLKAGLTEEELNNRTRDVQRKVNMLKVDVAAGKKTLKEAQLALEQMDVYMLEVPDTTKLSTSKGKVTILSTGTDITMNSVWITYDSNTARWNVTGGGYWANTNWWSDRPGPWWGIAGETKDMGGVDSVGVTYYNTSRTYNTAVVSSMGYVTDHNGWSNYMYNPSHGDGKYGVAFDYQDKMKLKNTCGVCYASDFTYYGEGFSASITYDSNFVNYNGYARTMYAHTWNTTTINSIGFSGGGGQFGTTISWSSSSNRFAVFNGSDTTF